MDNFNQVDHTKNKELAALTTNPDTTKHKIKFTDNSAQNQRLKLLDWLLEKNSITTTQTRINLDIMSPAARILELKRHGYLINTVPAEWLSEHGIKHKGVARYVLTQKEPLELVDSEVAARTTPSYLIAPMGFV